MGTRKLELFLAISGRGGKTEDGIQPVSKRRLLSGSFGRVLVMWRLGE